MKREQRAVAYSYEHGDGDLPCLKELVSDIPDPEKNKIIKYLRTNCIVACAGIIQDEIEEGKVIGTGDVFSDGTYVWNDAFTNYVEQYNIAIPAEFREHLLRNFSDRMEKHAQLAAVDRVIIQNNPYLGFGYEAQINKDGAVRYKNNTDCTDGAVLSIKPEDAQYIISPIMTELFCYDADAHGAGSIDGYHWKLIFWSGADVVREIEGWPGEDPWRYGEIKSVIEFAERCILKDMGSQYMSGRR